MFKPQRLFVLMLILLVSGATLAQDGTTALTTVEIAPNPDFYQIENVGFEPQRWNNCGPATITNALTHFGYSDNQLRAAEYLKPDGEDKNVSPWQMAEFVNTQIPELNTYAMVRYNGTVDLAKTLIANDFLIIIEKGYDPDPQTLGWMGHYLLITGYNDATGMFNTHDTFVRANYPYEYDYIDRMWKHFNYTYLVLYEPRQLPTLNAILGEDADERQNLINAFYRAQEQSIANELDKWAWVNMGTSLTNLGQYEDAAKAFDYARTLALPWRLLWYQFEMMEAYYQVGRYDDVIALAQRNLNDGGGHYVEETFYYGGLAREGLGEYDRALSNYQQALNFNPNFEPAREAITALETKMNAG